MHVARADDTVGEWSPVFNWPLLAIHAVLTPDARVMSYGTNLAGKQTGYFVYDLWDPSAGPTDGGHVTLPNTTDTDIFCSSQLLLPTGGGVLVAGGDNYVEGRTTNTGNNNSNLFDYTANTLTRGNNMNRQRWYSTATALLNGEIYIQGGAGGGDRPEIRGTNGVFRLLDGINTSSYSNWFPRNFLAADGRIFGFDVNGRMYYMATGGSGTLSSQGTLPAANVGRTSSAVMYRPGRILQIGGNSNGAMIVDINGLAAPVTTAAASMSTQRQWVNATVLADGRVLGTGGSESENQLVGVNNTAEIWDPATGQWTIGPSAVVPRLYHSNALLLPDASVLVAGGGAPGPLVNRNAEIYYPSYLYTPAGDFAARPTITNYPSSLDIGTHFTLTTGGAGTVSRVTLVKTGSTTHSFNMDQRFIELFFTTSGNQLDVMVPARAGDAPPGYYLLFVINTAGVPSMARIVKMNVAANPNPAADHTPTIGGLGGTRYQLACSENETLVGVHGHSSSVIDEIGPQCIRLDANGHWIGDPVDRETAGGSGGAVFARTCARDTAVTGFRGRGSRFLDQLDVECKALASNGKVTDSAIYLGAEGGLTGTAQGPFGCGTLNPGFALHGTSGDYVDGFGIQCRQGVLNAAPALVNPGNQTSQAGTAVNLAISATDNNRDTLSYSATGLPAGLSIDTGTGAITGTPTTETLYSVNVTVTDGSASGDASFTWNIVAANGAPMIVNPGAQSTSSGTAVDLLISASDADDGDTLMFSAAGLPDGLVIDPATGRITGVSTTAGIYNMTVTVRDVALLSADVVFAWTIIPHNPPELTLLNPGDQSGVEATFATLALGVTYANPGTLVYSASGLPAGLAIDAGNGQITGIATKAGVYAVTVSASDGLLSGSANFTWTIFPGEAFTLDPLDQKSPQLAGVPIEFTASAHNGVNTRYRWYFDDGTPETEYSSSPSIVHTFAQGGVHFVTVSAVDARDIELVQGIAQAVYLPPTENRPAVSSNILYVAATNLLWVVNQDNNSVTVFDAANNTRVKEIVVGAAPRTLVLAPSGEIWVTNKEQATISVIDPTTLAVVRTINLPFASQPFGIAFAPTGSNAYVALEGAGKLLKLDPTTGAQVASLDIGANPRHLSITHNGGTVYVSRFITPRLTGEDTAIVLADQQGGEVVAVDADSMTVRNTVVLLPSDKPDFENQGSGVPNYLAAATISPDGTQAWLPSKQDNVMRGSQRNGLNLNFQNTVRAISSRIDLDSESEDYSARIDHDNAGVASAAAFDRYGIYLFVALETSREIAVVDAFGYFEIFRFPVGRAPQGIAVSPDGLRLYVNNFMDRSVGVYDLAPLINGGVLSVPLLATLSPIASETLTPQVLAGKQLFYDAFDTRLARDRYMSCASCHNDGGQDGRVWDITGFGEGLRNTVSLRGHAGTQGFLHWSGNFDEVQDFEGQIRDLAGGSGLMADEDFFAGTRSEPLGDPKAGLSADLDALAAYVASLNTFANSPFRNQDGSLTNDAVAGKEVFRIVSCSQCHGGLAFTGSGAANLHDIGTLKASSGQRLYGPLVGIDTPTLRDVWATAPYLHDGSAATLSEAVQAHGNVSLSGTDLDSIVTYLQQIDRREPQPLPPGC